MQALLSRAELCCAILIDLQSKILNKLKKMYPSIDYIEEKGFL